MKKQTKEVIIPEEVIIPTQEELDMILALRLELAAAEAKRSLLNELYVKRDELNAQITELEGLPKNQIIATNLPSNLGVGAFAKNLILEGLSNKDVLAKVHEHYGNAKTTYACIAWYRNDMKKNGKLTVQ